MRVIAMIAAAVAVLSTACSSEAQFVEPPNDFVFQTECELQASGLPSQLVLEEEFANLQEQLGQTGPGPLELELASLYEILSNDQPTEVEGLRYVPQRIPQAYEPQTSRLADIRRVAGVGEVGRLANVARRLFDDDRHSGYQLRYEDSLLGHCDSFFEEDIRVACEDAQDGTSCFRLERIERRDLAVIEEACELAPYMLLCEPDDPPPYDLPRINEG